jgi:hypothetical protein
MPENNIWGVKIHLELDLFRDCAAFSESRFWFPDGDWGRSGRQPGAHLSLLLTPPSQLVVMSGTRNRSGCLTCRRRKKKCDEIRPICRRCQTSGASCVYPNASGSCSERYIVSLALDHYILADASGERHFVNTYPRDVARLCLSYDGPTIRSLPTDLSIYEEIPRPLSGSDVLAGMSERYLLQYCTSV